MKAYLIKKGVQFLKENNKLTKIVSILLIMFILISGSSFIIINIPVIAAASPILWLLNDGDRDKLTNNYVEIMTKYRQGMHDKIRELKKENKGVGVSISYPSLSLMVAYNCVLNMDKVDSDNLTSTDVDIDSQKLSDFLDTTVIYSNEGGIITTKVKDINKIAKITFPDDEDLRDTLIQYFKILSETELDNSVPEIEFNDYDVPEGGIELPYFCQYDSKWGNSPYGSSTVGKSGCGITCSAMVVSGMTNKTVYPDQLAAEFSNYYITGSGSSWSLFEGVAKKYGLTCKNLSRNDPDAIVNELGQAHPVIVSMSAGHFTRGGHFILLRGFDDKGKILVSDPASPERTQMSWDLSLILTESSTLSASCFWSFAKK